MTPGPRMPAISAEPQKVVCVAGSVAGISRRKVLVKAASEIKTVGAFVRSAHSTVEESLGLQGQLHTLSIVSDAFLPPRKSHLNVEPRSSNIESEILNSEYLEQIDCLTGSDRHI